jgi:hypothetical protein
MLGEAWGLDWPSGQIKINPADLIITRLRSVIFIDTLKP